MGFSWIPKNRDEDSTSESQLDSNSSGGSGSKLELDSNCGGVDGREEVSAELGSGDGNQRADSEVDEDEIVKRFQKLRLSAEEVELSEELLSINQQLQEDEVLMLLLMLRLFGFRQH